MGAWLGLSNLGRWSTTPPDPETVASASLQGLREQNRLTPFAARFVAVVTSSQSRFGLSARKTMIMPGTVRYELDLARLQQRDLAWNPTTRTLTITLPPVEVSGPEVDMAGIKEYDSGGVLMALTHAEQALDQANRAAAQRQLVAQAREAAPLRLARDAARSAVERSFAMPLRAAGIDATVKARFADEPDPAAAPEYVDHSTSLNEVYASPR
nr:DUF4230 domain-containing protein [Sphingomonas quercus]